MRWTFSRRVMAADQSQANRQWWLSLLISLVLFVALMVTVNSVNWPVSDAQPTSDTVAQLGVAFLGGYLVPFEVVAVLLSVALIGAVILARGKTEAEETE